MMLAYEFEDTKVLDWYCEKKVEGKASGMCGNTFYSSQFQFEKSEHMCPFCFMSVHPELTINEVRKAYGKKSWEKYNLFLPLEIKVYKTQKARGLDELGKTKDGCRIQSFGLQLPGYIVITSLEQFHTDLDVMAYFFKICKNKLFARPCPIKPRHGFLDSRPVYSIDEAKQLFIEMRKIDPESELVLMMKVDASHNAVITNTTAAIGQGNDGATAGRNAITLPVHGQLRTFGDSKSITESAYLEAVYDKNHHSGNYVVQLRNGPELPRTKDIIPQQITVTEVIDVDAFEPKDDLLAWEALCDNIVIDQKNGKRQGLVIAHVNGPIGSHFCVHAVLRNIPFMTTRMPVIGETLEKTEKPKPIDYRQVKKGIELGLSKEFTNMMLPLLNYHGSDSHSAAFKGMVYTSLYALHSYPVAGKEESKLIGLGIASLIRVSVCAALGESRHHRGISAVQGTTYRDKIYKKYFEDVFGGIKKLKITEQVFLDGSWSDSYGGKNWASCTAATIKLVNKAIAFVRKPDEANFQKVMGQFNKLINEVHNGGKFLNKFVSNSAFDQAAQDLALYVAVRVVDIYDFIIMSNSLDNTTHVNGLSGMRQLRKMSKKDKMILKTILDAVDSYPNRHNEECDCDDCIENSDD